jgi:hypothetical protein
VDTVGCGKLNSAETSCWQIVLGIFNPFDELDDVRWALGSHLSVFSTGTPQSVDRLCALPHQQITRTEHDPARLLEISEDARRPVRPVRSRVARLDGLREMGIANGARRGRGLHPRVVPASRDPEQAAHRRHWELGLVIPHEPEPSDEGIGIVPVSMANLVVKTRPIDSDSRWRRKKIKTRNFSFEIKSRTF